MLPIGKMVKNRCGTYIRFLLRIAMVLAMLSVSGCATYMIIDDLPIQTEARVESVEKVYATTDFWRTVCVVANGSYGMFDHFEKTVFCSPDSYEDMLYLEEGDRWLPKSNSAVEEIPFTFMERKLHLTGRYNGKEVTVVFRGDKNRSPMRYALLPLAVASDIVTSPFQLGWRIAIYW